MSEEKVFGKKFPENRATQQEKSEDQINELRRRIEQDVDDTYLGLYSHLSNTEVIHELSVYHVELLAQNDELQASYAQLETQLDEINTLFDDAPVIYFVVDPLGRISKVNTLGQIFLNSIGIPTGNFLAQVYYEDRSDLISWVRDSNVAKLKIIQSPLKGGWHQLQKSAYTGGQTLLIITDITELMTAKELANKALSELEQDKLRLNQSYSIVAHELRTPIASLKMMLDAQGIESYKPYGEAILSAVEHTANVLDDLQMIIDPMVSVSQKNRTESLYSFVDRTLLSLGYLFRQNEINITLSGDTKSKDRFYFRAQAVRQVLTNLFKNAAIHSQASRVKVKIAVLDSNDRSSRVQISITDNGVGIREDILATLFAAFKRGESDAPGSGLGLYVSKQLMEEIGGKLSVQSQEGSGTRFVLDLALSAVPKNDSGAVIATPSTSLAGKAFLVVDDDQFSRMLTERYLVSCGACVELAGDGLEALDKINEHSFNAVISDLNMPNMDGVSLLKAFKDKSLNVPFIIVTGGLDAVTNEELIKNGASAVLMKPLTVDGLVEVL